MNSHAEAPDPKSGVSANSTTPASEKLHSSLATTVIKNIENQCSCQDIEADFLNFLEYTKIYGIIEDMELDKKYIAKMTRIYGIIVILSNLIALIVPEFISLPVLDEENNRIWESFLEHNNLASIAMCFAFLIPSVVCIVYAYRIFRSDEKIVKNVAEIPSVFSLSSVIGWNVYYFIEIPFVLYARAKYGIHIKNILITSWGFALFSGMTAWTLSFLAIEILNRTVLLPKVFPEGHILREGFSFRPSFKHLMIYCFIVSSVFPVIILLSTLISVQINNNLEITKGVISISILLLVIAFVITISLSRLILNPLKNLTDAANRIQEGDYKTKVGIVTSDELGVLADSFNDMAESLSEKEFMRDTFGKVVDPEVRDYLMSGAGRESLGNALGGETREVTVLFCDIRSFTAMSEKMEAAEVVLLLNQYFTALGKCIAAHHGIINKYIGDAIMAIFGAPVYSENSAKDAFEAALDMRRALVSVNEEFKKEGFPELRFGVGIHTGPVFAGTIGAANRMEYTVIGDTVNTASRLESLCKTYGKDLLLSEASAAKLSKEGLEFVADAEIRGKSEPMKVYTA